MSQEQILLVEDQKSMAMLLQAHLVQCCTNYEVLLAHTLHDAKELLEHSNSIRLCLTDLTLPDSSDYEIVDLLREHKITTVVFTGSYSKHVRQRVFDARVADYIIKDGKISIDFAVSSVKSLLQNSENHIWMVSDNVKSIQRTQGLLRIQRYQMKVFETYERALQELSFSVPDLLIVERAANTSQLSVYDFVRELRQQFSEQELPIVALESRDNLDRSIKLMKFGVSDLLSNNYEPEELYLRVKKNLAHSQAYKEIKRISETDGLTKIYNRRAFFQFAETEFSQFKKTEQSVFLIMADIDLFKRVNDQYGHQVGDQAIQLTAAYFNAVFSSSIVARFGGEEFVVFGTYDNKSEVLNLCETFRKEVESQSYASVEVEFTVSQGVSFGAETLDKMIAEADEALYKAKEQGRNKVVVSV